MWTHLQPLLESELTAISIDRQARVALYRALNIGRLVLMAGSGLSRPFGYPSWSEFSAIFALITGDIFEEVRAEKPYLTHRVRHQVNQLAVLCRTEGADDGDGPREEKPAPDDSTSSDAFPRIDAHCIEALGKEASGILDLCDEILDRLGTDEKNGTTYRFEARLRFARLFRAGGIQMARARLMVLFPMERDAKDRLGCPVPADAHAPNDSDRPEGPLDPGHDPFVEALTKIAVDGALPSAVDAVLKSDAARGSTEARSERPKRGAADRAPDPSLVRMIVERRRISRVLTLNYDVLFERGLGRHRHIGRHSPTFRHLCGAAPTGRDDPRRVEVEDGLRRSLVSTTLAHDNIGELIAFGALPRQFDHQIFHLHGRHDDPDNMVVTQGDYRRVYVREDDSASTFEEAREVVFGGNDVLFAGVGMKEEDVLSPFRRFIGRDDRDDLPRNFFVLMARSAERNGRMKDELAAIRRAATYGILTIYYGGTAFKACMTLLSHIRAFLENKKIRKNRKHNKIKREIKLGKDKFINLNSNNTPDILKLFLSDEEWVLLRKLAELKLDRVEAQVLCAAQVLVDEIQSRVQSRALALEFEDLRANAAKWWDAWRQPPGERRPRANLIEKPVAGKENHLWVRHCPDEEPIDFSGVPDAAAPDRWGPLARACAVGRARASGEGFPPRRRILRVAIPRGGGAGAFVRLLLHTQRHSLLFGEPTDHAGAFVVHLAYSLEFSSVIGALTRFLARRVAELKWQRRGPEIDAVERKIQAKLDAYEKANPSDRIRGASERPSPKDVFIANSEAEPRLVVQDGLAFDYELTPEVRRPHRIDVLRSVLKIYAELATQERVLLVLSGLDQLCDENGDAYNPVHRAFFRLLGGGGGRSTEAVDAPLDLVLVSGRPDVPICYLSEEVDKPLPIHEEKLVSRSSGTGRPLRLWPRVGAFDWVERLSLMSVDVETRNFFLKLLVAVPRDIPDSTGHASRSVERIRDFLRTHESEHEWSAISRPLRRSILLFKWAEQIDILPSRRAANTHPQRTLIRLLWDNLALTQWALLAWVRHDGPREPRAAADTPESDAAEFEHFVESLDRAAGRQGFRGIVDVVLAEHRRLDQESEGEGAIDERLISLILDHLTLFTVPVEPIVLHDCPLISAYFEQPKASAPLTTKTEAFVERLTRIVTYLARLQDRGLVIAVKPAAAVDRDPTPARDRSSPEYKFHRRFTLHSRMREHLAQKMRLRVSDRGDRAHYQVSLYCDQPKDLPTPSPEHFGLVRDILKAQIDACRETIGPAYRFSERGHQMKSQHQDPIDHRDDRIARAAEVIVDGLFVPSDVDARGYAGAHWRIHALAHRIRGAYGLMRGAFSVGAISRLEMANARRSPFEDYSDWLRSILNIAIGIDSNSHELRLALRGELSSLVLGRSTNGKDVDIHSRATFEDFIRSQNEKPITSDEETRRANSIRRLREACETHFATDGKKASHPTDFHEQKGTYVHLVDPLYRDEIAWIYNERGVAALIQGKIFEALPLFERARFVVTHSAVTPESDSHAHHAVERRIFLNMAVAQIERGNIERARDILTRLERSSSHVAGSTPSRTREFARAYLALCDHLSGSLARAAAGYEQAIACFNERRLLRAVSIFERHLGELQRHRGETAEARRHVELALSAAAQAEQRDILHLAEVSLANIDIAEDALDPAQRHIDRALAYADKMALHGIRAAALLSRTNLLIVRGEYARAGSAAARSVAIGVRYGLGLAKLHGLELLAEVLRRRKQTATAEMVLEETKSEAERLHYQLRSERTAARLSDLDH